MCCLSPSDETSAESSVGKIRDTVSRIKVSLRQFKVALKTAAVYSAVHCYVRLINDVL